MRPFPFPLRASTTPPSSSENFPWKDPAINGVHCPDAGVGGLSSVLRYGESVKCDKANWGVRGTTVGPVGEGRRARRGTMIASLCLEQPLVSEENLHLPAQEKLPGTGRNLVAVSRAVQKVRLALWGAGNGKTIARLTPPRSIWTGAMQWTMVSCLWELARVAAATVGATAIVIR